MKGISLLVKSPKVNKIVVKSCSDPLFGVEVKLWVSSLMEDINTYNIGGVRG